MKKYSRIAALVLVDALIVNISYIFALLVRFEFDVASNQFTQYFTVFTNNMLPLTLFAIICFGIVGIYTSIWRYAGTEELLKIALGAVMAAVFDLAYITISDPTRILQEVLISSQE